MWLFGASLSLAFLRQHFLSRARDGVAGIASARAVAAWHHVEGLSRVLKSGHALSEFSVIYGRHCRLNCVQPG